MKFRLIKGIKERVLFLKQEFIAKMRKRLLGQYASGVIYETGNGIMSAPLEDLVIGKSLGFYGNWDANVIEELMEIIHENDVIYILGTHIGTLLIPISNKCKRIVGYEANPDTLRYVNWNIQANGVQNASVFHYAIGDTTKKIKFLKSRINTGGSKIKPIKNNFLYSYDNPETVEVDMISLDNHIQLKKLPSPTCLILDIEGAEYFALKGMQKALVGVRFLYIEFVPHP